MGRIFHQEVECRMPRRYSTAIHRGLRSLAVTLFVAACILQFVGKAEAQCTAKDVLQNRLEHKEARPFRMPQILVTSVTDVPVWKRITLGTFASWFALSKALEAAGCSVGELGEEILAGPAFTASSAKMDVQLVAISPAELGFKTDSVTLAEVYGRARQLGFEFAPAEVGPQLRLQYFDQPIGEFLIIGMEPIKTWSGEPVILTVANGGAGLLVIGQDGRPEAEIVVISRLVFVRPNDAATGEPERAAVLLPP